MEVNFVTRPFEATILLDGQLLTGADGTAYRTPCTVPDLPARISRVVFRHDGLDDLDAGAIDFAAIREVDARWESALD